MGDEADLYQQIWGEPPPGSPETPAASDQAPAEAGRAKAGGAEAPDDSNQSHAGAGQSPAHAGRTAGVPAPASPPEPGPVEPPVPRPVGPQPEPEPVAPPPVPVSNRRRLGPGGFLLGRVRQAGGLLGAPATKTASPPPDTSLVRSGEPGVPEAQGGRAGRRTDPSSGDPAVLERINQLEDRLTGAFGDLERRMTDATARGDMELRLKMEVSDKLREVALHLSDRLGEINREVTDRLDAYDSETQRRLDLLEQRMRRRDLAVIEGLTGLSEGDLSAKEPSESATPEAGEPEPAP